MKEKLSLKEIFQEKTVRLGIREIIPASGWGEVLSDINIRLVKRMPSSSRKNNAPTIAIITPKEALCRQMQKNILKNNMVFLILANSVSIPIFLKTLAANNDISIAASEYDEHYLRSLLQALAREKFRETIFVHGVVLEAKGKGILITGASGIGKTTAALRTITKDYYWVADDVAVIKRSKEGDLIARGHKKICNFLYIEATGIIPVGKLLKSDRIKVKTKLAAVVEIEKADIRDIRMTKGEKEVLGVKLTSIHMNIPSTSYFNENLLKKALGQLSKDNKDN